MPIKTATLNKPPLVMREELMRPNFWVESRKNPNTSRLLRDYPMLKRFCHDVQCLDWKDIESGKTEVIILKDEFMADRLWMSFFPDNLELIYPIAPKAHYQHTCRKCEDPMTSPFVRRGIFAPSSDVDRLLFSYTPSIGIEIWPMAEVYSNQLVNLNLTRASTGMKHLQVMTNYSIRKISLLSETFLEAKLVDEHSYIDHLGIVRSVEDLDIWLRRYQDLDEEELALYESMPQVLLFYQVEKNLMNQVQWEDTIYAFKITAQNYRRVEEIVEAAKRSIPSPKFKAISHHVEIHGVKEEIADADWKPTKDRLESMAWNKLQKKEEVRLERKARRENQSIMPPLEVVEAALPPTPHEYRMDQIASTPKVVMDDAEGDFNKEGANKSRGFSTILSHIPSKIR